MAKNKRPIDSQTVVNLIISSTLTQELNDTLKDTDKYMHSLKFHSKGLNEVLETYLKKYLSNVYSGDEEIYININRNLEQLKQTMSELALRAEPADFIEMNQLINLYFVDRKSFHEVVTPVITKLRTKENGGIK